MAASKVILGVCCGCSRSSLYSSRSLATTIVPLKSFFDSRRPTLSLSSRPISNSTSSTHKRAHRAKVIADWLSKKKQLSLPKDDVYIINHYKGFDGCPVHSPNDAIDVLKAFSFTEERETMRLNIKVNMGKKETTIQSINGTFLLPHPFGSAKKLLVFAEDDLLNEAKAAGADFVGGEELFPQIEKDEIEFDYCLSSLDFLDNIKHLQKILKGKMPNTRRGTATDDLAPVIKRLKYSQAYKSDRYGAINLQMAQVSISKDAIKENLKTVIAAIDSHRLDPDRSKFFEKIYFKSTFGPTLLVNTQDVLDL